MAVDRERILQTAQKYVAKKKYDRAIAEYQKIVQTDPNDARTLLKIGDLQSRLGLFAEAIGSYDRVGEFYAKQGFALKAIAVYKQIRELIRKHAPQLEDRYGHITPKLAEIYTQLGLTSDALSAYDEVAARLQRAGRDRDAIEIFDKMVQLDSTNPLPHLRLAEARCRVQSVDEAITSFWTAAELLIQLGRRDDALKVVERILHFKQDTRFAKVAAGLYLQKGTHADGMQALAKLQLCFQKDPKDLETLELLAQAFGVIGQAPKALEVKKEIARIAKEQNRTALFRDTVAHLMQVAPGDEQVGALAQQLGEDEPVSVSEVDSVHSAPATSARDAMATAPSVEVEDIDFDDAPVSRALMTSAPDVEIADEVYDLEMQEVKESSVVVVEEDLEAIEELTETGMPVDADGHIRKALSDADSFRGLRLYGKAMETISIALELDPRSVPLREKLRDVLAESGDQDSAIGEMISIATVLMEDGDLHRAEAELYSVLELEPEHALAYELLEQLGGFALGDQDVQEYVQYTEDASSTADVTSPSAEPARAGLDHDAPLPSYDLEEVSAADILVPEEGPYETTLDAPLPSFPLGMDDDVEAHLEAEREASAFEDGEVNTIDPVIPQQAAAPRVADLSPGGGAATEAVEEALDEAEFFAARGLLDDARGILTDQLDRTPNHPLLLERLREFDKLSARSESGAHERQELEVTDADIEEEDDAFDIAASLDALDDLEEVAGASRPPASINQEEEVDVETVFAKFKEGVAREVSDSDSATHYDLGVAYKEMGLAQDAIAEFEIAARSPQLACTCCAMIGMIHLERGELDDAAEAYIRGLGAAQKNIDQEMTLYYDLGIVYEMKSSTQEAVYYFKKIARRDPGYRDVKERLATLEGSGAAAVESTRSINAESDFDAAFDDLFESK